MRLLRTALAATAVLLLTACGSSSRSLEAACGTLADYHQQLEQLNVRYMRADEGGVTVIVAMFADLADVASEEYEDTTEAVSFRLSQAFDEGGVDDYLDVLRDNEFAPRFAELDRLYADCGIDPLVNDEHEIAELVSAVRNAALEIEREATVNSGRYPDNDRGQALVSEEASSPINLGYRLLGTSSAAFCVWGQSTDIMSSHHVKYVSDEGGVQEFVRESGSC